MWFSFRDPIFWKWFPEGIDTTAAIACPIPGALEAMQARIVVDGVVRGSATFHLSRTLHYTGPKAI